MILGNHQQHSVTLKVNSIAIKVTNKVVLLNITIDIKSTFIGNLCGIAVQQIIDITKNKKVCIFITIKKFMQCFYNQPLKLCDDNFYVL